MHEIAGAGRKGRRGALAALLTVGTLLAIAPAGAMAATLTPNNYNAGAGETNALTVTDSGAATITYVDTGAVIVAGGGCLPAGANAAGVPVVCPGTFSVNIDLGDLNDETAFAGGSPNRTYFQNGGAGNDTLRGPTEAISNTMNGDVGADVIAGGAGDRDFVEYIFRVADVNVSLDDIANDGEASEGDNVRSTVEGARTGDGNDTITGTAADNLLGGGAGNDTITGGAGDDDIQGDEGNDKLGGDAGDDSVSAGPGADTLAGGDGNDFLSPGQVFLATSDGADDVSGGSGADSMSVSANGVNGNPVAVVITLDDLADDGIAGEGDNYRADIEDVQSFGDSTNTVVGNASPNIIGTSFRDDAINGGAGNDVLTSGGGNDTIAARDGFADRVDCGVGTDVAIVDTLDLVGTNCETVQTADVGNANEDVPPTVAFVAPAENALLPGRASTITVNAADDRAIARVVLIDDGRIVGVDTVAPYAFTYQPTATDVGRNTLIAQAVDGSNQAATDIRTVRVDRFTPARVSAAVSPARDRARPYRFRISGAVSMPRGVTRAQGCRAGTVRVTGKRGTRTVFSLPARVRANCTYAVTAAIGSRGSVRFTARFAGNTVLKARSSATRTARAG